MRRKNKNRNNVIIVLFLFLAIGFAYLTTNFSFVSNFAFRQNTWNVYVENPVEDILNTVNGYVPLTVSNGTTVSFGADMQSSTDVYKFYVDVVNDGSVDAMVGDISIQGMTDEMKKYLDITVCYKGGIEVEKGHYLRAGDMETLEVTMRPAQVSFSDNDGSEVQTNFSLVVEYVIAKDEEAYDRSNILSGDGHNIGDEIILGGEPFIFISENNNQVQLIAKHNLYVGVKSIQAYAEISEILPTNSTFYGLQHPITDNGAQSAVYGYTTPFSKSKFWSNASNANNTINITSKYQAPNLTKATNEYDMISIIPQNNNFSIQYYLREYVSKLDDKGIDVISYSYPTSAFFNSLGINIVIYDESMPDDESYYDDAADEYPFLFNSSYWLATAGYSTDTSSWNYDYIMNSVLGLHVIPYTNTIYMKYTEFENAVELGVRPIIVVSSDYIY